MSAQNLQSPTTPIPNRPPTTTDNQSTRDGRNATERVQQAFSAQNTNRLENLIDDRNSAFVTTSPNMLPDS